MSNEFGASNLVGRIQTSIGLAMHAKFNARREAGRQTVGFTAGQPDFPTPKHIQEAAHEAILDVQNHKYSDVMGLRDLRTAVAKRSSLKWGLDVEPNNVIITDGAKHAVYESIRATMDPEDEVLVPTPYWTSYPEQVRMAGAVPVLVDTQSANRFCVTVANLNAHLTPKTRMLILCNPSNPTGSVYSADELKAIGQWALEHNIWVLVDEIYDELVYSPRQFVPLLRIMPELRRQCLVVNGVSKTYAMTGWRVGWIVGPQQIVSGVSKLISHTTTHVSNISQRAAIAALNGDQSIVQTMRSSYEERRDRMLTELNKIPNIASIPPEGAMYVFVDVQHYLHRHFNGRRIDSTLSLSEMLLEEADVAVFPGEAFGTPGYLRLCYAVNEESIVEGVGRMKNFFDQVEQ